MTVHIAVMTCSARWGSAERLACRIGGAVWIVYDNGGGVWDTARRCWEALAEQDGTHALLLQDDAAVCRDFRESVQAAVKARPGQAIGFYSHRDRLTERAFARGEAWFTIPGGAWGICTCLPLAWIWDMLAWLDDPESWCSRFKKPVVSFPDDWDDRRVGAYLRAHDRKLHCTVPSLVEHMGNGRSLLGHNNRNSHASWFIGEAASGLTVDWGGSTPQRSTNGVLGRYTLREGTYQEAAQLLPEAQAEKAWIKDYKRARWVIAEHDGEVVGCACAWMPYGQRRIMRLSSQFVSPAHRGAGLNGKMVQESIRMASANGTEVIEAHIWTDPKGPYAGWTVEQSFKNGIRKVRTAVGEHGQ